MRSILSVVIVTALSGPVWAEDFTVQPLASAATIYPQGASVRYQAAVALPAGKHRVLLPFHVDDFSSNPPRLQVTGGVRIGAINYLQNVSYRQEGLLNDAQRAAKAAVEAGEKAVQAKQDEIALAQVEVQSAALQMGFLGSINGKNLSTTDTAALIELAQMVGDEGAKIAARQVEARTRIATLQKDLKKLQTVLDEARRRFARLSPPSGKGDMLAVSVEVAKPVMASFDIDGFVQDAGWSVTYDFHLDTTAPSLAVTRKVSVAQYSGKAWPDINLTLATANPFDQLQPSHLSGDLARIGRMPQPVETLRRSLQAPTPMLEKSADMVAPGAPISAALRVQGLSVSYVYPRKVTLETDELVQLTLDSFNMPVTTSIRAVPRYDETAFLMAHLRNDTGQPLLPGRVALYRDGAFIGREDLAVLPAGGKADLSFGALEGLRLSYTRLRGETGDSGLITKSNTRDEVLQFSVENLTDKAQHLRALYALPYSEQEDLQVSLRLRPKPDETDVDNVRGVAGWDMSLAPGEKKTVRVLVSLVWPKNQQLDWQP